MDTISYTELLSGRPWRGINEFGLENNVFGKLEKWEPWDEN